MPSGFTWSTRDLEWKQTYVDLPVYEDKKLLLVPKHTVRFEIGVDHSKYRRQFVLEYLQAEHLRADDSLVTILRDKEGRISRKVVGRVSELSRRLVMGLAEGTATSLGRINLG